MANILVIDDSSSFRTKLKNDLKELGHDVTEASDGREAIQIIEHDQIKFDLVFCDINMPGINGFETLEILQEKDLLAELTVFMLTTEGSKELKQRGKDLGVRAWITKPYNKDKVMGAVSKIITN
ncbi:MAG: response regulator [Bacteriovoracaceae bacterium]